MGKAGKGIIEGGGRGSASASPKREGQDKVLSINPGRNAPICLPSGVFPLDPGKLWGWPRIVHCDGGVH